MNPLRETLIGICSTLRSSGSEVTIGDLLDGLRLADEIATETQLRSLKNSLRVLWSVGADGQIHDEFESAWQSQVERRIQYWLAVLQSPSSSPPEEIQSSVLASPTVTSVQAAEAPLAENPPISLHEVGNVSIEEDGSEIKPPPTLPTPLTTRAEHSAPSNEPDPRANGKTINSQYRSTQRKQNSRRVGHPGSRRFKIRLAVDSPELLPRVGVVPVGPSANLKFAHPEAIFAYRPISRLSLTYGWRYLRRLVPDGPVNVLDIDATIAQVAYRGFFLSPVYRRWQSNHAHLMLLIDQKGSMTPFHGITHDLVDTARKESSIKQVDVFYFHNVFDDCLYTDNFFGCWIKVDEAMRSCTPNTSILIVSDAGAARGNLSEGRYETSCKMIMRLQQSTSLVAWLNPFPRDRWIASSAETIANEIKMFQLDTDGFSNAIDVLQGRGITS